MGFFSKVLGNKEHEKLSDADEQFNLGVMYNKKNDYKRALGLFSKAAEQGHPGAQCTLGLMYYYGQGIQEDHNKAAQWFTKAAKQEGEAAEAAKEGLFTLAFTYQTGNGVKQDYKKAVEWYSIAAKHGYTKAQINLGVMYADGLGVQRHYMKAAQWFAKAAKQGNEDANRVLETCIRDIIGMPVSVLDLDKGFAKGSPHYELKQSLLDNADNFE